MIEQLCEEEVPNTQDCLLKDLMRMTLELWKGARTRPAVKFHLHQYFGKNRTRRNEAEKTLLFVSKVYHNVRSFIQAAERLPMFKSIELVKVSPHLSDPINANTGLAMPLEASKRLEIHANNGNWINDLNWQLTKFASIAKLLLLYD